VGPSRQEAAVHGGRVRQEREWSVDRSLDWHLLDNPLHQGVQRLVRDLNAVLQHYPALHQLDVEARGFEWITHEDRDNSVLLLYPQGRRRRRGPGRVEFHAGAALRLPHRRADQPGRYRRRS
jgi:1,4-alpha-glucan branching enzyme